MQLSQHFTLEELIYSKTALSNKIDNTPKDKKIINNLTYLAINILEPIRKEFGAFSVSSAYRCKELNTKVKGSKTSMHLYGNAVDIDFGVRNLELFEFVKNNLDFSELINEYPDENGIPKWCHIGLAKGREKEKKIKVIV